MPLIERAAAADANDLIEYLKQIGGESDNLSFGKEGVGFMPEQEAEYLSSIENSSDSCIFLAKENGNIIGCGSLSRSSGRMKHRGDISVSVLRAFWGLGVATLLTRRLIDFAKENGFGIIDLQVRSDNSAAIHIYEKLGFKKNRHSPGLFQNRWQGSTV